MKPEIHKDAHGWYVFFPERNVFWAVKCWADALQDVRRYYESAGMFPEASRVVCMGP